VRFDDPQDRKALVMGLALHEQGKQILEKVLSQKLTRHHLGFSSCCWRGPDVMLHSKHASLAEELYLHKQASRGPLVCKGNTAAVRHDVNGLLHAVCSWVTYQLVLCHRCRLLTSCCGLLSAYLLTVPQPSHALGVYWLPFCHVYAGGLSGGSRCAASS